MQVYKLNDLFMSMACFVGIHEVCLAGTCDCLRGHDSDCVEHPISCRKEPCEELLPHSTCHPELGW